MTMRDWIADVLVNAFIRLHPIPAVVKLPSSLSYDATSWRGKSAGQSVFVPLPSSASYDAASLRDNPSSFHCDAIKKENYEAKEAD